jgi:type VI secretion system protein VasJ
MATESEKTEDLELETDAGEPEVDDDNPEIENNSDHEEDAAAGDSQESDSASDPEGAAPDRVLGSIFEAIISPFDGEAPYGEDVTYGDRCDGITEEIQKLTAATSKEISIDWKRVRTLCIEVLTEESKDLRVACYLTVALFRTDGYPGARDGLDIIHAFVADHWEGIFPPVKKRARRANDLRFVIDRLPPLVDERDPQPEDFEHLQAMVTSVPALADLARELLLEKDPRFGELITSLKKRAAEAPAPAQPEPEPKTPKPSETGQEIEGKPEPEASAATPAPSTAAPSAVPVITIEANASVSAVRSQIEGAVKPLRDAEPLSPVSYRILRLLKWDGITGPTGAGKTQLSGPRSSDLNALQIMHGAGNWPALLDKSENLFRSGLTWFLDLQRYTTLSLENMDPTGAASPAAETVKDATSQALKRNPNLTDCSFSNDTPFASDETRTWLAEIATEGTRVGVARESSGNGDLIGLEAGEVEQAIKLFREKKLTEGMEVLQRGVENARGPRAQFRARLDAATACLDSNQASWARPMLESLQREIGTLSFELWERSWAIELHQLLAICYGRLAKITTGEQQENCTLRLNEIKDALLRLDMRAAAAVEESI